MKTLLCHANLIDCVEPKVQPDTAVLIEDGRIRAILPSGEAGSAGDAQVVDLKGGYLMPGLWDVHIHPDYLSLDEMPLADQVTLFGHRREFEGDGPLEKVAAQILLRGADAVQLGTQEIDEATKPRIVVQRDPLGVHEIDRQRL